jgi:DNA-binding NtrC family response regulator
MIKNYKILIVEDNDDIRLNLKNSLKNENYEIFLASDGVSAIKVLIDNLIDIIVTDYKMEMLGGSYWVKFLQKFCPDMKIIFISGFLDPNQPIPYPILYKPFKRSEIIQKIKTCLDEPCKKEQIN